MPITFGQAYVKKTTAFSCYYIISIVHNFYRAFTCAITNRLRRCVDIPSHSNDYSKHKMHVNKWKLKFFPNQVSYKECRIWRASKSV